MLKRAIALSLFFLAFIPAQRILGQSPQAGASDIAARDGIVQAPFPHLKGTAPLTLPAGIPLPPEMTYPQKGSIFAVQFNQERDYWLSQIAATRAQRDKLWRPDFSSPEAYRKSLQQHRNDLRKMLGLIDLGAKTVKPETAVLETEPVRVEDVTLTLDEDFRARALLFVPQGKIAGAVIAVPDATESREGFAGISEGGKPAAWLTSLLSRQLAVCVPVTVERKTDYALGQRANFGPLGGSLDRRLLLYRMGFIVGRTLVGIEVQQVLALRDYLVARWNWRKQQVALMGEGQGGMTAFYAAAVDGDFGGVAVADYFQQREDCWKEPADRMIYGQLNEFGDAEVAALIAPRPLRVFYGASGATPATRVQAELSRAQRFYQGLGKSEQLGASEQSEGGVPVEAANQLANALAAPVAGPVPAITVTVTRADIDKARNQHLEGLHAYLARLDAASDAVRANHWKLLSTPASERAQRAEQMRSELARLMGMVEPEKGPLNARTHLIQLTDKFAAYDVLLDALPGVEAYGQLLVPRGLPGRLPVVICQHGLGGTPADITGVGAEPSVYHALGSHLADMGYVVFAPYVNVPIKQEVLVNELVREAAPLGKMRTSIEVAKLHRIVDFLQSLPFVNPEGIGYYGLSYGGYSAIWMPPLEPRIKLSVVSGHFNDWRAKITDENASHFVSPDGKPYTYATSFMLHPDADNFNWNMLNRFTHPELIAAMWPRPVCVEYGDYDTTTTPEWHLRAWKQVEAYRDAWDLGGLDAKVMRVHYNGVHEIHGVGTVDFVNRWLRPQRLAGRDYVYDLLERQQRSDQISGVSEAEVPYRTTLLDASAATLIRGRFHVSTLAPSFEGIAFKLSRVGDPGDVVVRFGTKEGGADLGEARIRASKIDPLFDLWYKAEIKPVRLDPGKLYFFQLSATSGQSPDQCYVVYGPKPFGGKDIPPMFGLSYQVLATGPIRGQPQLHSRYDFMRPLMASYDGGPPVITAGAAPRAADEILVGAHSAINVDSGADDVVETAAEDLRQFLHRALKAPAAGTEVGVEIRVVPSGVEGVTTDEGYRVSASKQNIQIQGRTSRGVMRGVYALEDAIRARQGPFVKTGLMVRNCRFSRRITDAVRPAGVPNRETSFPLPYTDGLLQRISHTGFNGLWVWVNSEEVTLDSKIFPELDDSEAAARLSRLADLSTRAKRYGIDVYLYFANGYDHHLPDSFWQKHPDIKGYGWGPPMCTSVKTVRDYYTETIATIFHHAPLVKGLIVIYDSEGFWYCGNSPRNLRDCPRCRHRTQQEVAAEILTTFDDALHQAGPDKELIARNYNVRSEWTEKLVPLLPKDIIIEPEFDKGMVVTKDGITSHIEDYVISSVGPPDTFKNNYEQARSRGMAVDAKTEVAVSQEFIFVPYIPCMEQWYQRIAKMREYDLGGYFANWFFYGFTGSRPEELATRMSFDPAPSMAALLQQQAERDFGREAAPYVIRAWHDYSEGIRAYPYSDPVARYPGPSQKGPSNPFFVDPKVKNFGQGRAWQNDLRWTRPWGPALASKDLGEVEDWYAKGNGELEAALKAAPSAYRPAILSELRIGRMIQTSLRATINLIDWLSARDQYFSANSDDARRQALDKMMKVAAAERANAEQSLPDLEADLTLGYASDGAGLIRGGLFDEELVRWTIGELDDVLVRQLPALMPENATAKAGH